MIELILQNAFNLCSDKIIDFYKYLINNNINYYDGLFIIIVIILMRVLYNNSTDKDSFSVIISLLIYFGICILISHYEKSK